MPHPLDFRPCSDPLSFTIVQNQTDKWMCAYLLSKLTYFHVTLSSTYFHLCSVTRTKKPVRRKLLGREKISNDKSSILVYYYFKLVLVVPWSWRRTYYHPLVWRSSWLIQIFLYNLAKESLAQSPLYLRTSNVRTYVRMNPTAVLQNFKL